MSHQICYLIDLPGEQFNDLMDARYRLTDVSFDDVPPNEGYYRDAKLRGSDEAFTAEFSGRWTLASLAYPYAAFLFDPVGPTAEIVRRVEDWERHLRQLLPSVEIVRIDEALLNPWMARTNELVVRDDTEVRRLIASLSTADPDYWKRIPTATDPSKP
jgi:hypothetical protein